MVAAAIADPVVEYASNAGFFGPGTFTDHSNLDVVPALLAGIGLFAFHLVRKARAVASTPLPRWSAAAVPAIFGAQILTLYVMETAEQFVVYGHPLAPNLWLGGPSSFSLAVHAVVCVALTAAIVRSRRRLAASALKVAAFIAAAAAFPTRSCAPPPLRRFESVSLAKPSPVLCTIGGRAPPPIP